MTGLMIWTQSGLGRWDGAFADCEQYHLLRHEQGRRKVTWSVLRGTEVIGTFDRRRDASEHALNDFWKVYRTELDAYLAEGRRKSRENRDRRQGEPFKVIEREQGVHRSLELRVSPIPDAMPFESWQVTVYEPEYQERYGEIGVHHLYTTAATEQLAKMAAEEFAEAWIEKGRLRKAGWDAKYPASVTA
jgi:hypothetical protein